MEAAGESSLESMDVLLRAGADANTLDYNNRSALFYALDSNNLSAVKRLLPLSDKGMEDVFLQFPKSSIHFSEEVKSFINSKLDEKPSLLLTGLHSSSELGHLQMLRIMKDFLRYKFHLCSENIRSLIKTDMQKVIVNAIRSDNYEACLIVKDICDLLNYNIQDIHYEQARKRKNKRVINLFANSQQQEIDDICYRLNEDLSILDMMPKTLDILYNNEIQKIKDLILENECPEGILCYEKLLEKLHVKDVHYKESCTWHCPQKEKCQAVRDSVELIKFLLNKISKDYDPIFKNTEVVIVGSLKERTKINEVDEADCLLVLDKKYGEYLEFKSESQTINFVEGKEKQKELEPYRTGNNQFDHQLYFMNFMKALYSAIDKFGSQLPKNLSMDPLSTNFDPCQACMSTEFIKPVFKRCHHRPDCKITNDGKHQANCDCKVFTSPSLTYSKIGGALHLRFGKFGFNLDIDINPPNIPTCNIDQYDGSNWHKRQHLEKTKPVGWLDEWMKSVNMQAANDFLESKRSVR